MRLKMRPIGRFFTPPRGSFFLFGPRGTGKSSWTLAALPRAVRFDLLEPATFRELAARPERLEERLAAERTRPEETLDVVIDEVQRLPELLPVVHRLLEGDSRTRFVLTGSSARKVRREGTNLLGGRAALRTLHPFLATELGPAFRLAAALERGLVPLVLGAADPAETLRAYAALYLHEEVRQEALVRDLGAFSRFLEAMSFSQGQTLNLAAVARECQVSRKLVAGYLEVLEDLLLGFRLPVFTRRARRALAAHAKFYYFDCGVFRSLRPRGPLDRPEEIDGAALEGLIAQQLRAWIAYRGERESLAFWRTRSGVEVDFVVYGEAGLTAIEVKNTGRVRPEDLRGLVAFGADYPQSLRLLLYRGRERLRMGDVLCLPCDELLAALHPARDLADAARAGPAR